MLDKQQEEHQQKQKQQRLNQQQGPPTKSCNNPPNPSSDPAGQKRQQRPQRQAPPTETGNHLPLSNAPLALGPTSSDSASSNPVDNLQFDDDIIAMLDKQQEEYQQKQKQQQLNQQKALPNESCDHPQNPSSDPAGTLQFDDALIAIMDKAVEMSSGQSRSSFGSEPRGKKIKSTTTSHRQRQQQQQPNECGFEIMEDCNPSPSKVDHGISAKRLLQPQQRSGSCLTDIENLMDEHNINNAKISWSHSKAIKFDPNRPICNKRCSLSSPDPSHDRYIIVSINRDEDLFVKILGVVPWSKLPVARPAHDAKKVYLHGDWFHCPLKEDDVFNIVSPSGSFVTSFDALPLTFSTA